MDDLSMRQHPGYGQIEPYSLNGRGCNLMNFNMPPPRPQLDLRGMPLSRQHRPILHRDPEVEEQPRRRIAVACGRCRKRKIRCSGDPGDQSGCQNCKAAGVAAAQCQFHRVGSDNIDKIKAAQRYNDFQGLTVLSSGAELVASLSNAFPSYTAPYSKVLPSDQYMAAYPTAKSTYSTAWAAPHSLSYAETTGISAYSPQTTACMASQEAMTTMYAASDSYRNWATLDSKSQPAVTNVYAEPDVGSGYAAQSITESGGQQYMSSANARSYPSSSDPSSSSSLNMASLQSSLPTSLPARHLPMPATARTPSVPVTTTSYVRTQIGSHAGTGTGTADNTRGDAVNKSESDTWADGNAATNKSSNRTKEAPVCKLKKRQSAPANGGYCFPVKNPQEGAESTAATPALSYPSTGASAPATSANVAYAAPATSMLPRIGSNELIAPRPSTGTTGMFTWNSESIMKRDSMGNLSSTEGTLVSGHKYVPLAHPTPQPPLADSSLLRHDSFDHRIAQTDGQTGSAGATTTF